MDKYQKWMSKENLDPALKAELVSMNDLKITVKKEGAFKNE